MKKSLRLLLVFVFIVALGSTGMLAEPAQAHVQCDSGDTRTTNYCGACNNWCTKVERCSGHHWYVSSDTCDWGNCCGSPCCF